MVKLRPVHFTALHRAVQRVQPAPAFQHDSAAVVIRRLIDLEETLRAAFIVDDGTVAFCKARGGQHKVGFVHDRGALMVNHHYQRRFAERRVNAGRGSVAMQIVFQHDDRVSGTGFQLGKGIIKCAAANHAETNTVHRTGNHGDPYVSATTLQCFCHVGCRMNDVCAAGVGAGNDQRFFRTG